MTTEIHDSLLSDYDSVSLGCITHESELLPVGSTVPGRKRLMFLLLHRHLNFRIPEVDAVAEMAYGNAVCPDGKPPILWEMPHGNQLASPYWFGHVITEAVAHAVVEHCMLVRCAIEPFGYASTLEELHSNIASLPASFRDTYAVKDQTFKFVIEGYGCHVPEDEKIALINTFQQPTNFEGKIELRNPMHKWWVIVVGQPAQHAVLAPLPSGIYFGREFGMCEARLKLAKYDLKKRKYIGPTSMDPELAFIMCNMGKVKRHSIVLDPNVGTGSMLVAAADKGAHTMGFDIDIRVVKLGKVGAKGEKLNLWTNFAQYNLPPPIGLWRGDMHRSAFRPDLEAVIDTIICDPPYGVRAGGRKSNSVPDMNILDRSQHVPSTAPYNLAECLRDLVDMAARILQVGGRLVYWVPVADGYYNEDELPTHPAMAMIANSEQVLAARYSRRLITMAKVRVYDAAEVAAHYELLGPPVMSQDSLHEMVYAGKEKEVVNGSGERKKNTRPRMRCKNI